jgi:ribosomal protein S19E (S16A)
MNPDRAILILLAINEKKLIVEMEHVIGASRQIVQRYLAVLHEGGYYIAEMGPTGKNTKPRGRKLTETGRAFLRNYGHNI